MLLLEKSASPPDFPAKPLARATPHLVSLQPRKRLRAFVPNAFAACNALVDMHLVAVPRIEKRVGEAGKRRTMRTASPIVSEMLVREVIVLDHDQPPLERHQPELRRLIVAKRVEMRLFTGAF